MKTTEIKNLLYKELRFALVPPVFIFVFLSVLVLVPNYPSSIAMLYFAFAVQIIFQMAKEDKDAVFMAMLPISKKSHVTVKFTVVILIQLLQIIFAAVFAIIYAFAIAPFLGGSPTLDANFAFFGTHLIGMGIFNLVFFTMHYKTGYKIAKPIVAAMLVYVAFVVALELLILLVPILSRTLDGYDRSTFGYQFIVLAAGVISFVALNIVAYKISVNRYDKANIV